VICGRGQADPARAIGFEVLLLVPVLEPFFFYFFMVKACFHGVKVEIYAAHSALTMLAMFLAKSKYVLAFSTLGNKPPSKRATSVG
jgi:hypothetical protein